MFILLSISRWLEFWSGNYTSIYENFESNVFKNIKLLGEISNNWPNDLLGTNVFLQCINTTSVIFTIFIFCHLTFSASK